MVNIPYMDPMGMQNGPGVQRECGDDSYWVQHLSAKSANKNHPRSDLFGISVEGSLPTR